MEKPNEEELAAALTLADSGHIAWHCDQAKWDRVITPMLKHCKGDEDPTEAATRILAQAYRAMLAKV